MCVLFDVSFVVSLGEKVNNLIESFLEQARTIILCVIPANQVSFVFVFVALDVAVRPSIHPSLTGPHPCEAGGVGRKPARRVGGEICGVDAKECLRVSLFQKNRAYMVLEPVLVPSGAFVETAGSSAGACDAATGARLVHQHRRRRPNSGSIRAWWLVACTTRASSRRQLPVLVPPPRPHY